PIDLYFTKSHAAPVERIWCQACPEHDGIFTRIAGCDAKREEGIRYRRILRPCSTKRMDECRCCGDRTRWQAELLHEATTVGIRWVHSWTSTSMNPGTMRGNCCRAVPVR